MKNKKPLFVPLMKRWFDKFASGTKRVEYRVHGPRWNRRVCSDGRAVTLANGYGWPRLSGRIARTVIIPPHRVPKDAREIFGNRELIRIHIDSVRELERPMLNHLVKEENEG
jgi:hypothetical protein